MARSYVHLLSSDQPEFSRPDDFSPRDRVGHGTSVAMIAAGQPVDSPVGTLTGIAPKAFLGNYKIFGSADINEFSNAEAVIRAIDDAVIDGMDVISISFGAVAQFPFDEHGNACSDDPQVLCDPVAIARSKRRPGLRSRGRRLGWKRRGIWRTAHSGAQHDRDPWIGSGRDHGRRVRQLTAVRARSSIQWGRATPPCQAGDPSFPHR